MLTKVLGGATVVMVLAALFMGNRLMAAKEEIGAKQQALDQATLTNQRNQRALDEVEARFNKCVDDRKVDQEQNAVALANLERHAAEVEARKQRVRVEKEEIFRDPTCEELGNMDIAAMCPRWAEQLRDRSAAFNGN